MRRPLAWAFPPVSRPTVSLIVPFAGTAAAARTLADRLAVVRRGPDDEVIVVDNSRTPAFDGEPARGLVVHRADDHPSSYYARNAGADVARGEWLLFVDADCEPRADLIERHLDFALGDRCGAVAGAVLDAPGQSGLVARYTRARGLFNQRHYTSLGPWAFGLTANLLVRRAAFEELGGFCEGIRSAGDKEFCWRLLRAGWRLEYNDRAAVVHHHREAVSRLGRQVARYSAGNAWFARRHAEPGWLQEPDGTEMAKGIRNVARATLRLNADGVAFRLLDAFALVVRRVARRLPNVTRPSDTAAADVVLCAGRFPMDDVQLVAAQHGAQNGGCHVEALRRPLKNVRTAQIRGMDVAYVEDDADLERWRAALALAVEHPAGALRLLAADRRRLLDLAPAARRIAARGAARLEPLDDEGAQLAAGLTPLLRTPAGAPPPRRSATWTR
jgi:GT2 family glycosyltransferase